MAAAFGISDSDNAATTRRDIFREHARRRGLVALGAFDGPTLVGFCYGFPGTSSSWWYRQVRPHLAVAGNEDWLTSSFELVELHVLPEYQRRCLGRQLLCSVCAGSDLPRVILSTPMGAAAARRLYTRLGFRDLTGPFAFGGAGPPYTVMGTELPLPDA